MDVKRSLSSKMPKLSRRSAFGAVVLGSKMEASVVANAPTARSVARKITSLSSSDEQSLRDVNASKTRKDKRRLSWLDVCGNGTPAQVNQ